MTRNLEDLTRQALDVFWYIIAKSFPEATYGDLSPERTICLIQAAETAVKEWVSNNVPRGRKKSAGQPRSLFWHTPGPWFVDRQSPHSPLCIKPFPGRIICDIEGTDGESESNALLIAAAPELYSACAGMCGLIYRNKRGSEEIDFDRYERAEAECRTAMTKATETEANGSRPETNDKP